MLGQILASVRISWIMDKPLNCSEATVPEELLGSQNLPEACSSATLMSLVIEHSYLNFPRFLITQNILGLLESLPLWALEEILEYKTGTLSTESYSYFLLEQAAIT